MTTQPTPLPPTVAELRWMIQLKCAPEVMHLVDELASRAADPAPVADEAAIEKWQRDFSLYVVRECPERPNLLRFGEAAVRLMRARLPDIVVSREEVEAAASLMRAAPRNDETAWLIEWPAANGEPARWWRGQCSNWGTADQAIRFCRKRDAEAGIETLKLVRFHGANMDLVATEHSWIGPASDRASDAGLLPAGDAGESDAELSKWKTIADTQSRVAAARFQDLQARDVENDDLRARLQARDVENDDLRARLRADEAELVTLRARLRADEAELVTLRARLQAAEAERDEKAELLDKVTHDAEEFFGKLSDILDKNLVPDGEPLARVKEAIEMLTETILERDKLEAERDKLAADLAAAQKERDEARAERDYIDRACMARVQERETMRQDRDSAIRSLAAAKAEGVRAVVEVPERMLAWARSDYSKHAVLCKEVEEWIIALDAELRAAQPQPTPNIANATVKQVSENEFLAQVEKPQPTTAAPATNGREGDDVLREFLDYSKDFSRDEKLDSGLCALVVLVRRALEGKP